jgi:steroid delta-isomerase-like uncharacterized protein
VTATPKQLAVQIIEELWNRKNPALIGTLYAANCTIHTPDGEVHGPSGATQLYTAYTMAFPDTHYAIEDVVGEGERVVIRFTFAGTHRGELRGIAPTGKPVAVAGMVLFRFANGQVIEQRGIWDSLSAMRQLGVVQGAG